MEKITWAPKIKQSLIWQIYQNDSLGMVDEELLEDVGYRLYNRCQSIWLVTRREVRCPRCGAVFPVSYPDSWNLLPGELHCPSPGCGWSTTAEAWHNSWRHRDLLGTAAMQAVETYLRDYLKASTPEAKMVCIDNLIHAFHVSLQTGKNNRSFANNLIEGSHEQVLELLDKLFAKPGRVDKDQWRDGVDAMWKNRRGEE